MYKPGCYSLQCRPRPKICARAAGCQTMAGAPRTDPEPAKIPPSLVNKHCSLGLELVFELYIVEIHLYITYISYILVLASFLPKMTIGQSAQRGRGRKTVTTPAATRRSPRKLQSSKRVLPSPEPEQPKSRRRTAAPPPAGVAPNQGTAGLGRPAQATAAASPTRNLSRHPAFTPPPFPPIEHSPGEAHDAYAPEPTGSDFEEEDDIMLMDIVPTKVASTSKDKSKGKASKKRLSKEDNVDDEPKLMLRKGLLDETPDDLLLTYTITWLCKVAGKKVVEDGVRNVKDCLEVFWKEYLYRQREHRLQQSGASKHRKFRICRLTVKSPGKGLSLPFTVDDDSPTSGTQWKDADDHLIELGNKYVGRELIVKIEWEFDDDAETSTAQDKTGACASSNMFRELEREMESEKGEACRLFTEISAVWRCDNPHNCSASGNDRKKAIPCWTDSKRQHYKLLSPLIHVWVDAILQKVPGVNVHQPPQSVIDLLTAKAEKPPQHPLATPRSSTSAGVKPIVNNIFYGERRSQLADAADTQIGSASLHKISKAATPAKLPASSPFRVHESKFEHDTLLHEYGFWLEHRCFSQHWRHEVRKAIDICDTECLRLEYARKKPLDWWQERGIKEGVARMFCDDVKEWRNWRTAENGKIKKVQVSDLIGVGNYVMIVDPEEEKSAPPSRAPSSERFPDIDFDGLLAVDNEAELREMLAEQRMYEAQPVDSHLEASFSQFLTPVADFNNSHS